MVRQTQTANWPLKMTFINFHPSEKVKAAIQHGATGLQRFFNRIVAADAVLEALPAIHGRAPVCRIRLHLELPHHRIVVTRDHPIGAKDENVYWSIRKAFRTARHRLVHHTQRRKALNRSRFGRGLEMAFNSAYGPIWP